MTSFGQDLRYGLRRFIRNPGFGALAVMALALGIGANTAIFSVASAFLRKPIDLPHLDRLVMVMNLPPGETDDWNSVSAGDYLNWKAQSQSFEKMGAYAWTDTNLTGNGEPERLEGSQVSGDFLEVLGVKPQLGRGFSAFEETSVHENEAILSYGLWQRSFAADPSIVGKTARLNGKTYTIAGVMPKEFNFPAGAEIWIPLTIGDKERNDRSNRYLFPVARLKPGATVRRAQAEMLTIFGRIRGEYPKDEEGWSVRVTPLGEFVGGVQADQYCELLIAAVIFLLLIACANVANLLFARAVGRQREMALRRALGASRARIVRQLLTESVLLAAASACIGLLLGEWGIGLIRGAMSPDVEKYLPMWKHVRLEMDVFWYTVGVALLAGLISGLAPGFLSSRTDVQESLKEGGHGSTTGRSRHRLRDVFVIAEVTMSLILLACAALMSQGLRALLHVNENLEPERVFTMMVSLPDSKYQRPQQAEFYSQAIEQLQTIPGTSFASVASMVPFGGEGIEDSISIQGRSAQPGEYRFAYIQSVNGDFFRLMKIPLRSGRLLDNADGAGSANVVVVSERFAKQYFPGENPLGKMIKQGGENSKSRWSQIVGIVGDIKYDPYERNEAPPAYFSFLQVPQGYAYLAFRTTADPGSFAAAARSRIETIDPTQPVYDMMSLDKVIRNQMLGLSIVAGLLSALGIIALTLASTGVYGVMAFSVAERTHEIGVRMALGAQRGDVLRAVARHGIMLMAIGLGIGLPLSLGLARLIAGLVYGVSATDAPTFLLVAALMCGVTLLACYIPARRAMNVDPMVALRYE
jgi:putative ABC transport system permease protein